MQRKSDNGQGQVGEENVQDLVPLIGNTFSETILEEIELLKVNDRLRWWQKKTEQEKKMTIMNKRKKKMHKSRKTSIN